MLSVLWVWTRPRSPLASGLQLQLWKRTQCPIPPKLEQSSDFLGSHHSQAMCHRLCPTAHPVVAITSALPTLGLLVGGGGHHLLLHASAGLGGPGQSHTGGAGARGHHADEALTLPITWRSWRGHRFRKKSRGKSRWGQAPCRVGAGKMRNMQESTSGFAIKHEWTLLIM